MMFIIWSLREWQPFRILKTVTCYAVYWGYFTLNQNFKGAFLAVNFSILNLTLFSNVVKKIIKIISE